MKGLGDNELADEIECLLEAAFELDRELKKDTFCKERGASRFSEQERQENKECVQQTLHRVKHLIEEAQERDSTITIRLTFPMQGVQCDNCLEIGSDCICGDVPHLTRRAVL